MPGLILHSITQQPNILFADVRDLQTNIGDLIHSQIPNDTDVIAAVKNFVNDSVPSNFRHNSGCTL